MLAEFEDPALEDRSLDYAVSGKVRNQDAAIQMAIAMQIPETRERAWKFIKENWDQVHAQLTTAMGSILVGSTSGFCSAGERDDVQGFFAAHKVEAADVALRHLGERINGCIELRSEQGPILRKWLAQVEN